ncbi:hypothetical protein [Stenotrophomonas maltophilia]|uniref:hypothetical protein n=1 Tax=Stenotrophomonas maltophilia TaxID=40324 RepID=UPI00050A3291|nr:hypothetical protein [Stenotrophomonas maltophilia]KGM23073.1 hypothetical protein LI87_0113445 [Stenotrophomonas maltophilia]
MKLIIKEFLSQLRESGELDRLLPDLLARMKLIPISRAQVGVRQNGVDIAAVGKDKNGIKTLYLFVLKVGDLGRRDWDGGVNAVRATLNQIQDSYLHTSVREEHQTLPVKVVICSTGELKQEVQQDYTGYINGHTTSNLRFEFWSGDDLADMIDAHLLDEYAIDPSQRADLRRAIALIGSRDYDLRHAYKIAQTLLIDSHDGAPVLSNTRRRLFVRQMKTVALVLEVVFRWADEEGNLLNAFKMGERCCLWAWEAIRVRDVFKYRPAISAFRDIYQIHHRICAAYFDKLKPFFWARDGLSGFTGENALVTDKVFEQIGILAEIGLMQQHHAEMALGEGNEMAAALAAANADGVADTLIAAIKNNASSGSPRYDGNAIELSLAFLLLHLTDKHEAAKQWLDDLASRVSFAFKVKQHFPVATDAFDDLVAMEVGELSEDQVEKLRHLSTLVPTLMYWSLILGHDEVYHSLRDRYNSAFEGVCLQLWYADDLTESVIYRLPAQYESGTTEALLKFPEQIGDLLRADIKKAESKAIVSLDALSAVKQGPWVVIAMACRHFRTPFPPQFWMPFLLQAKAADVPGQMN